VADSSARPASSAVPASLAASPPVTPLSGAGTVVGSPGTGATVVAGATVVVAPAFAAGAAAAGLAAAGAAAVVVCVCARGAGAAVVDVVLPAGGTTPPPCVGAAVVGGVVVVGAGAAVVAVVPPVTVIIAFRTGGCGLPSAFVTWVPTMWSPEERSGIVKEHLKVPEDGIVPLHKVVDPRRTAATPPTGNSTPVTSTVVPGGPEAGAMLTSIPGTQAYALAMATRVNATEAAAAAQMPSRRRMFPLPPVV
jgi:hypothetical protein